MIFAFISIDLIIFNCDERNDSAMKMLKNVNIILNKMNSSDTPRMLKTIVIHLSKRKDYINFEQFLNEMDFKREDFP